MTVPIPPELEQELLRRAQQSRMKVEEVVKAALHLYFHTDPSLLDELDAWQEIRDEALGLVEDSPT
jgi:hypothetical protein